jgi:Spy/CpxP family protein refolding chaperone
MNRKIMAAFTVALTLGAASLSQAQTAQGEHKEHGEHADHMKRGPGGRGRGGPMGMLLRNLDLTQQQKDQIRALHEKNMPEDAGKKSDEVREKARAARERGDTAEVRKIRTEVQGRMKEQHERMLSEVRNILTPAQRTQFDKNVAEAEKRMEHRRDGAGKNRRANRNS